MRIDEIESRKAEIMGILESGKVENLDELEKEVRELNTEAKEIAEQAAKAAELRAAVAPEVIKEITSEKKEERKMFEINSVEYRIAWLKNLMGKTLTTEERTGMDSGSSSGGYAIPEQVQNKVIENLIQVAPLLGEIDLLHVPGNVTILVEGTVAGAAKHTENASISVSEDTLTKINLGGYEYVKTIQISAKLSLMSIDAFEDWIVKQLARKLGECIEDVIVNGDGSGDPKGFDYLSWVTSSTGQNAVDWASTAPTVAELETQMGLLNGAYLSNAKWIMSWKTFMVYIHTLRDDKCEAVFTHENGGYYVFGFPVVFSSKCADGKIYFGDLFETVKANFAQDINVEANASAGFERNCVVYRGTCIFDCNCVAGRMTKSAASF